MEARSCPGRHSAQSFTLRPVGFRDSLQVEVTYNCTCGCSTGLEPNSARCSGNGTYICGLCECDPSYLGTRCECQEGENQSGYQNLCREAEGKPLCSGRGECSCNQCSCFESEFGRIYGPFCECDSFSCARNKGVLCSGRPPATVFVLSHTQALDIMWTQTLPFSGCWWKGLFWVVEDRGQAKPCLPEAQGWVASCGL